MVGGFGLRYNGLGLLRDTVDRQEHLPDKRWTVHILCEEDDAEERDKNERRNTFLYVSLNAFHHVTQTSSDNVVVVNCIVVYDEAICTAVCYARPSYVVIFLLMWLMDWELG